MSTLDSIINLSKQRRAESLADISAIPTAIKAFTDARASERKNTLSTLDTRINAAKNGLRIDFNTGEISRDNSALNESDLLDLQNKRLENQMLNFTSEKLNASANAQDGEAGFGTMFSGFSGGKPQFKEDTPLQIFERTSSLRKEFNQRQNVKDFNVIRGQVEAMDSFLKESLKGNINGNSALDQALVMTFNKALDPESVVRESEFARTPEGLSFMNRFAAAFDKFERGGVGLTNEDRISLVQGSKIIANEKGLLFQEAVDEFTAASTEFRVNPSSVVGKFKFDNPFNTTVRNFSTIEEANKANLPAGSFMMINGKAAFVDEDEEE